MTALTWTTETRCLGDLVKWEPNPRQLTKEQAERLQGSIAEFGYSQLYEIEPDGTIIDGHQRDEVMLRMKEFGNSASIEVRVASRQLTLEERKKYIAYKVNAAGEWDPDKVINLYDDFEEMEELGFDVDDILKFGFIPEVPDFQPVDENEQPRLDQKKPVICPECGCEFVAS